MIQKIAAIIAEAIAWGDNPYNDMDAREGFARKILDLLKGEGGTMREKIAKELYKGLFDVDTRNNTYVYKRFVDSYKWGDCKELLLLLASGILSLPTDETVKEKCPLLDNGCTANYDPKGGRCPKPCTYSRPLTLGELPDRYGKMREALEEIKWTFTNDANEGFDIIFASDIQLINDALKE